MGFPPKSSIKKYIGFSMIFTIHLGVSPYFWKHPNQEKPWNTVDGSEIPNNHRLDGAKTL